MAPAPTPPRAATSGAPDLVAVPVELTAPVPQPAASAATTSRKPIAASSFPLELIHPRLALASAETCR